jgi:hypothetical protein
VRLVFFCGLAMLGASPAWASFGDCNDSAYLAQFDPSLASARGFLCVESDRVPVTSEAGTTHIRIVQHLVADWATRPGAMRAIKDGVAASVSAMGTLGSFRISDVTILLIDSFGPGAGSERFGEIAAGTDLLSTGDECHIAVWLLGPGATAAYGASMISHELFHCVQRSSLTNAQMRTTATGGVGGGGTWWGEGSADWFSTAAVPAPDYLQGRVRAFDSDSPSVALNAMSYNAYVFFAWLGGAHGHTSVVPFLRNMASSAAPGAQRTAMADALTASEWLRFAEAYLDQQIRDGQGASINSTPVPGELWEWRDSRVQNAHLDPFVLARNRLNFHCGRWSVTPRPATSHAARPEGGAAWAAIPVNIDTISGGNGDFRLAEMNATSSDVSLAIDGRLSASCAECAGTHETDRCLVGTWEMSVDGMEQWMREHIHKANVTGVSQVGNTLTLNSDGTFAIQDSRVSVQLQGSGGISGQGSLNGSASGRWSAEGGHLNLCPDESAMSGTISVTKNGHTTTIPHPANAMPPSSRVYSCGGSSFTLTTQIGSMGNAVSTYTKMTPSH